MEGSDGIGQLSGIDVNDFDGCGAGDVVTVGGCEFGLVT